MKYVCKVCGWIYDEEEQGKKWEELPDETKLELSFILGGITSTLRTFNSIDDIITAKALATSRIGIAARQTLAALGA